MEGFNNESISSISENDNNSEKKEYQPKSGLLEFVKKEEVNDLIVDPDTYDILKKSFVDIMNAATLNGQKIKGITLENDIAYKNLNLYASEDKKVDKKISDGVVIPENMTSINGAQCYIKTADGSVYKAGRVDMYNLFDSGNDLESYIYDKIYDGFIKPLSNIKENKDTGNSKLVNKLKEGDYSATELFTENEELFNYIYSNFKNVDIITDSMITILKEKIDTYSNSFGYQLKDDFKVRLGTHDNGKKAFIIGKEDFITDIGNSDVNLVFGD